VRRGRRGAAYVHTRHRGIESGGQEARLHLLGCRLRQLAHNLHIVWHVRALDHPLAMLEQSRWVKCAWPAHDDSRHDVTVARYESDPATGEGKQELLQKARAYEQRRDRAAKQDPNLDFSQALFQIAIVLGSVSIVAASCRLQLLGIGPGGLAIVLMLNGFLLLFDLPFD
jgi:Domain of unknown function (DUF4337)